MSSGAPGFFFLERGRKVAGSVKVVKVVAVAAFVVAAWWWGSSEASLGRVERQEGLNLLGVEGVREGAPTTRMERTAITCPAAPVETWFTANGSDAECRRQMQECIDAGGGDADAVGSLVCSEGERGFYSAFISGNVEGVIRYSGNEGGHGACVADVQSEEWAQGVAAEGTDACGEVVREVEVPGVEGEGFTGIYELKEVVSIGLMVCLGTVIAFQVYTLVRRLFVRVGEGDCEGYREEREGLILFKQWEEREEAHRGAVVVGGEIDDRAKGEEDLKLSGDYQDGAWQVEDGDDFDQWERERGM